MEFMKVNGGAPVDIKTALQWQLIVGNTDFTDATITNAAVVNHAAENGISASSEEIQKFFEEVRYDLQLETKDDFDAWMNENKLDLGTVQNTCEIGVLRNKIRDAIPDDDLAEYFNNNKEGMDVAELYSITVESEDLASELMAQIEEGEDSFQNLALEHSTDQDTYRQGGFNGEVV